MRLSKHKIQLELAATGKTQADLAAAARMTTAQLSSILNRGACTPKNIGRIAKALGLDVSAITIDGGHEND